ncbi:DUF3325 domain-containing protein [Lampropedia puyangensis]|uniref:DUF3325 domain-containing protein n=1 Tax=Lampropedia puyangensis TaxID=1330072 RepID=A0A4S8F710_9BURK|nr:DUF3325 domain-containing protein [Lampropedia puyangensis]THU02869.1 DUF3325 domain-containing protein [Lampropedia puyangensis]
MNHIGMHALCLISMAALAMSMDKYQSDWYGRELSARSNLVLRSAGWLALVGSLIAVGVASRPSLAMVAWFGHLNAAAAVVLSVLVALARRRAHSAIKARATKSV